MASDIKQSMSNIHADARVVANFEEVARRVADQYDDEVEQPATTALTILTEEYINQFSEDFDAKGEKSWVYAGGGNNE